MTQKTSATAQPIDTFLAFSTFARKTVETPVEVKDPRHFLVRTYLRRVVELQESCALALHSKRYATAFALLRPIHESALYGMYLATLAPDQIVALTLANTALGKSIKLPMSPSNIARKLSKKRKDFNGLAEANSKWWGVLCDNTHGNPIALPLSLMNISVPLDPSLRKILVSHAVGSTILFLGIAEDINVFDRTTETHKRTVFFAKKLLKEI